jgi:uncharacterized protein YhhL (DUF1145 family)
MVLSYLVVCLISLVKPFCHAYPIAYVQSILDWFIPFMHICLDLIRI